MAKAQGLGQYSGRLTVAEIAAGINAAKENAARLHHDSEQLLNAGSFASATALAILAIEEAGKESVLRELAVMKTDKDRAACWKRYRTHTAKNVLAFFLDRVASGARTLEAFRPLFEPGAEFPGLAEHLKQVALYTDCLGKKHWSKPTEVITESLARSMVLAARAVATGKSLVTEREVALWQEHMGPVWGTGLSAMKTALVNWNRALVAEGIKPSEKAEGMEAFVWGLGSPGRAR